MKHVMRWSLLSVLVALVHAPWIGAAQHATPAYESRPPLGAFPNYPAPQVDADAPPEASPPTF